jgi:hypothetical protein
VQAIPLALLVESTYSNVRYSSPRSSVVRSAAVFVVHMPPRLDQVSARIAVALSPLATQGEAACALPVDGRAFDVLDARRAHRINAENHSTSGHNQNHSTSGYAPTPATSGHIPTHATSGCWSEGKLQARREAS